MQGRVSSGILIRNMGVSLYLGATPIDINGTQLNKHRKEIRNGKGKRKGTGKGTRRGRERNFSIQIFQSWNLKTELCLHTALGMDKAWCPWISLAFQLVHSLHSRGNIADLGEGFMLISQELSARGEAEMEAKLLGLRPGFTSPGWCFPLEEFSPEKHS